MSHPAIETAFFASMIGGLIACIVILIWWGRRSLAPLLAGLRARGITDANAPLRLNSIAMATLWRMLPGMGLAILVCLPMFYFGGLRKQEVYCRELIAVNRITDPADPDLVERCGRLDIAALLAAPRAAGR